MRRNKLAFAGIGIVACSLAVGLALAVWALAREHRARAEADLRRQEAEEAGRKEATHRAIAEDQRLVSRLHTYAADIKAAQAAFSAHNFGQGIDLLDRYRTNAGEEDLRGIEWRYLWQEGRPQHSHSWQHTNSVLGARVSPDGRFIVTDCFDGFLRVWDIATRNLAGHFQRLPSEEWENATFCFDPAGQRLAVREQNSIVILSVPDCRMVRRLTPPHSNAYTKASLAWSPDGRWLATSPASFIGSALTLWDTATWNPIFLPLRLCRRPAFSPDSKTLIFQSGERIELLDLETLTISRHIAPQTEPQSVQLSPDGKFVAVGSYTGMLRLYSFDTGALLWSHSAHRSEIIALAFSPEGNRLASGGFDQSIRLWDVFSGAHLRTVHGHLNEVWSLQFAADGGHLISASKDGTARLWAVRSEAEAVSYWLTSAEPQSWRANTAGPNAYVKAKGSTLLILSSDGRSLLALQSGSDIKSIALIPPLPTNFDFRFSPSGSILIVADSNGTIHKYRTDTGERSGLSLKLASPISGLYDVSPDEQRVAAFQASNGQRTGIVWDLSTGETLKQFPDTSLMRFSEDGHLVAIEQRSEAASPRLQVWDLARNRLLHSLVGHSMFLLDLAFSPSGDLLAGAGADGQVRLWDLRTGMLKTPPLLGHGSGVAIARFSRDGKTLLTSGYDHTLRFWHVATGREMLWFPKAMLYSISSSEEIFAVRDYDRDAICVHKVPGWPEIQTAGANSGSEHP